MTGYAVDYPTLNLANLIRQEQGRGSPKRKRATKGPDPGTSGPGNARLIELAFEQAKRSAARMGIGPAISSALYAAGLSWASMRHRDTVVASLTLRIAAYLKMPDPEPRAPRKPRVPRRSDDQTRADAVRFLTTMAQARGQGPMAANFARLMNGESPLTDRNPR